MQARRPNSDIPVGTWTNTGGDDFKVSQNMYPALEIYFKTDKKVTKLISIINRGALKILREV